MAALNRRPDQRDWLGVYFLGVGLALICLSVEMLTGHREWFVAYYVFLLLVAIPANVMGFVTARRDARHRWSR